MVNAVLENQTHCILSRENRLVKHCQKSGSNLMDADLVNLAVIAPCSGVNGEHHKLPVDLDS